MPGDVVTPPDSGDVHKVVAVHRHRSVMRDRLLVEDLDGARFVMQARRVLDGPWRWPNARAAPPPEPNAFAQALADAPDDARLRLSGSLHLPVGALRRKAREGWQPDVAGRRLAAEILERDVGELFDG